MKYNGRFGTYLPKTHVSNDLKQAVIDEAQRQEIALGELMRRALVLYLERQTQEHKQAQENKEQGIK